MLVHRKTAWNSVNTELASMDNYGIYVKFLLDHTSIAYWIRVLLIIV